MFEGNFGTVLVYLVGIVLLSLPLVNRFFQKRANDYADELLKDNPVEYNKQIKGNAYRYLISRSLWGLLFIANLYNIWNVELKVVYFKLFFFIIGLAYIFWGIYGFKSELKKIQELR